MDPYRSRYLAGNVLTIEKFIQEILTKITNFALDHYIVLNINNYPKETKENLEYGQLGILIVFAGNYLFIVQDAAQSVHGKNGQLILYPFVVYYKAATENIEFVSIRSFGIS